MFMLGFFSVLCTQRLPPQSGCLKRSGNLTSCGSLSTATISTFEIQQISSMPFKVSINHLLPPANEVWEGYVFIGVCLSTWGVSASGPGGCLPPPPQADTPLGKHAPRQTPLPLGKHPPGQTPPLPNACWDTPPFLVDTTGYGQQAGGTHPTGMHSCFILLFQNTCKLGYQN